MAAEIEEVLVEADRLDLEELAPDRRDATLRLRARSAVRGALSSRGPGRPASSVGGQPFEQSTQ
jgi:hypothetical protein